MTLRKRMNYPDAILVYYTIKVASGEAKKIARYEGEPEGLTMDPDAEILFFDEIVYAEGI